MLGVQANANAARAHLKAQRPKKNASSADTEFNRSCAALAARFRLLAPM